MTRLELVPNSLASIIFALLTAFTMSAGAAFADISYDVNRAYNTGDYATAMRLFKQIVSDTGDPHSRCSMATMYLNWLGVNKDEREAFKLFLAASLSGYALAINNVAVCYRRGIGVSRDAKEAIKLFRKAAASDDEGIHGAAMASLGEIYAQGEGVPQDLLQALMRFDLAVEKGSSRAKDFREDLSKKATPAQISQARQLAAEWKLKTAK